jgi:hypothetical protein
VEVTKYLCQIFKLLCNESNFRIDSVLKVSVRFSASGYLFLIDLSLVLNFVNQNFVDLILYRL